MRMPHALLVEVEEFVQTIARLRLSTTCTRDALNGKFQRINAGTSLQIGPIGCSGLVDGANSERIVRTGLKICKDQLVLLDSAVDHAVKLYLIIVSATDSIP